MLVPLLLLLMEFELVSFLRFGKEQLFFSFGLHFLTSVFFVVVFLFVCLFEFLGWPCGSGKITA